MEIEGSCHLGGHLGSPSRVLVSSGCGAPGVNGRELDSFRCNWTWVGDDCKASASLGTLSGTQRSGSPSPPPSGVAGFPPEKKRASGPGEKNEKCGLSSSSFVLQMGQLRCRATVHTRMVPAVVLPSSVDNIPCYVVTQFHHLAVGKSQRILLRTVGSEAQISL